MKHADLGGKKKSGEI